MVAALAALLPLLVALGAGARGEVARADAPEAPDAARTFAVRRGSTLAYRVVHELHAVDGVSREVEGRARLLLGGTLQVAVRARVDSFDSGNGNRDAHMREATEAARFPFVALKAVGALAPPRSFPATIEVVLRGELSFHGRTEPVEIPVRATFAEAARVEAEGTFALSLERFGVERPALLFVKVRDRVEIKASLLLEEER